MQFVRYDARLSRLPPSGTTLGTMASVLRLESVQWPSTADAMKTDEKPSTELLTSFTMNPFHLYLYGPDLGPMDSSFEAAAERLAELEKLHFEPDGSFVWTRDGGAQQIYGMLYDAAGQIQYCELQGQCKYSSWRTLVRAIQGPANGGPPTVPPPHRESQPVQGQSDGLLVMSLPGRELQELQTFEKTNWATQDSH